MPLILQQGIDGNDNNVTNNVSNRSSIAARQLDEVLDENGNILIPQIRNTVDQNQVRLRNTGSIQQYIRASWIKVANEITFAKSGNCFVGKLVFENQHTLPLTYSLKSIGPRNLFTIYQKSKFVHPDRKEEIIIASAKGKAFGELCSSLGFVLFATPVYFRSQLSDNKCRLLWKAFGSPLFPCNAAETHIIDKIIPKNDEYLDLYNMIWAASLGNYIRPKTLPNLRIRRKMRIKRWDFFDMWGPFETLPRTEVALKYKMDQFCWTVNSLKRKQRSIAALTMTVVSLTIIMITCFILFVSYLSSHFSEIGVNGVQIISK